MAITSRTAAARVEHEHTTSDKTISNPAAMADVDSFFQFMDFTFSDETNKNGGEPLFDLLQDIPSNMNMHSLPFDDLPSPVPLRDMVNSYEIVPSQDSNDVDQDVGVSISNESARAAYTNGGRTTSNPKPQDILSVRGVGHSKNPGNLRFRELVNSKKSAYERTSCATSRKALAVDIVSQLLPGRFLKKADVTQRVYQIMDYDGAVQKALFAVRDVKLSATKRKAPASSTLVEGKRKRKPAATSK